MAAQRMLWGGIAPTPPPPPPQQRFAHPDGPCGCGARWTSFGIGKPDGTGTTWMCGTCWRAHPSNRKG